MTEMKMMKRMADELSGAPSYTDKELLDAVLRGNFYAFVQKVFETTVPGAAFSQNWSTEAVAHNLEKVVRGETTRLIISIDLRLSCAASLSARTRPHQEDYLRQL
jgi:hypothetical protein